MAVYYRDSDHGEVITLYVNKLAPFVAPPSPAPAPTPSAPAETSDTIVEDKEEKIVVYVLSHLCAPVLPLIKLHLDHKFHLPQHMKCSTDSWRVQTSTNTRQKMILLLC